MLVARQLIGPEDLQRALEIQKERGEKIGKVLIELGFIAARDVLAALSEQLGIPVVTFDGPPPAMPETEGLAPRFMRQCRFLPYAVSDSTLTIAMADPLDFETISAVRGFTGLKVDTVLAAEAELLDAIDKFYGEQEQEATDGEARAGTAEEDLEQLRDMASEAPVIRLVNTMIAQAAEKRSSDIHIEPFEKEFRVRYRVDGVLYNQEPPPRELKAAIISRVKLMAKLNIAERRLPQDGRIKIKVMGREVDLRVSTLPTLYGESVVMRLLDRSAGDFYDLYRLGFDEHMLKRMEHYTSLPHGILLVTGPTGSGKSTTLYSALKRINQPDKKIITIEDPVEYQLNGVVQVPVNEKKGLTFARGLRSILRHDPDKVMVGEIRDPETAQIAVQSALTGHLVFTTLHANNACDVMGRFSHMGISPYSFVSALNCVMAQRLVRVACPECRREEKVDMALLSASGLDPVKYGDHTFFAGPGCDFCGGTGYRGRVAVAEFLNLTPRIRKMIVDQCPADELRAVAVKEGMVTLRKAAMEKALSGETTLKEINRVTFVD